MLSCAYSLHYAIVTQPLMKIEVYKWLRACTLLSRASALNSILRTHATLLL